MPYPVHSLVAMDHLGVLDIPLDTAPVGGPRAGDLLAGGPRAGAPLGHALGALEGVEDPVQHLVGFYFFKNGGH